MPATAEPTPHPHRWDVHAGRQWPGAWTWLAVALTVSFLGAVYSTWFVPIGGVFAVVALVGWHWPREEAA